jgi:hypothetical protein
VKEGSIGNFMLRKVVRTFESNDRRRTSCGGTFNIDDFVRSKFSREKALIDRSSCVDQFF